MGREAKAVKQVKVVRLVKVARVSHVPINISAFRQIVFFPKKGEAYASEINLCISSFRLRYVSIVRSCRGIDQVVINATHFKWSGAG